MDRRKNADDRIGIKIEKAEKTNKKGERLDWKGTLPQPVNVGLV